MKESIIIGSRGSKLALIQTQSVATKIREMHPGIEVNIRQIVTAGDRDRQTQLNQMGVAVFVKELEEALLDNTIDLAVHSLKDMPTELHPELCLASITERLDCRDTLVSNHGKLDQLAHGSVIGTSSLRRTVQLGRYRPDLIIRNIRGNVDTRLGKVDSGEYHGTIVAAAALLRLGCEDRITEYLPPEHFLPAAGQGALAIETRLDNQEVAQSVAPLNHLPTRQSVTAERAFLGTLAGGCRLPIAALATVDNGTLSLEGMVADIDGRNVLCSRDTGPATSAEEVGTRLARKLLDMGAAQFMTEGE